MSARQKAYEAVEAASFDMRDGDGASGVVYPSVAADAASDVWERYMKSIGLAAEVSFDDQAAMQLALLTIQGLCKEALDG